MNEDICFRVWDRVFNEYWTDEQIKENAGWLLFPNNANINDIGIEKYIGKKDKNDKLIYEGDIIKTIDGNGVVYRRQDGCFAIRNDNYIISKDGFCPFDNSISFYSRNKEALEIIGNTHNNPELLEK